jgi:uncharacterized phage infection (PIP) family protein YhgE
MAKATQSAEIRISLFLKYGAVGGTRCSCTGHCRSSEGALSVVVLVVSSLSITRAMLPGQPHPKLLIVLSPFYPWFYFFTSNFSLFTAFPDVH